MVPVVPGQVAEPCGWVDDDATVCTACLPKLSDVELLALANVELVDLQRQEAEAAIVLKPEELIALSGAIHLARRHPDFQRRYSRVGPVCDAVLAQIAEVFEFQPAVREVIRRGDQPLLGGPHVALAQDRQTQRSEGSTIIIP